MNPNRLNLNLSFSLEGVPVQAVNMTCERFRRTIPSHSHGSGCYEIHYIPSGYGKLTADGQTFRIEPNTLFVTGPHVEHAQAPQSEDPMLEYCIYLKIKERKENARGSESAPVIDSFTSTPFWFGADTQGVHGLLHQLSGELERRPMGFLDQARLLLSQLLIYIVRNYENARPGCSAQTPGSPLDLTSVIIEEYFLYEYRSLSLEELAKRLQRSPRQTQRLLLEYYGKSYQQKKAEAKMSAAAILLADQSKNIASISEELGYSSPEHFSAAFRGYYGATPREYRKGL